MKVVCINDSGRPNEIPITKWVKKADVYTVIDYIKYNIQGGKIAYILEEIDLTGCEPWKGFSEERFIPVDWISRKIREYNSVGE
jgi:hypothetical protein